MWVGTVKEGERRFIAAWRKGEEDEARHRHEKRDVNETRKVVILKHGRVEPAKRHQLAYLTSRRHILWARNRPRPTLCLDMWMRCVFFLRTESVGGRGVRCQTFFFLSFP